MSNITKVVFTDLFWETLGQHRKHPRYHDYRRVIAACVLHKAENRGFTSNSDKPFTSDPTMKGIWHCKLSRNPDVILFYRMTQDTLYLGMVGDHHDYRYNNKGSHAGHTTADRIEKAISRGNRPLAEWENVRWSTPSDLLGNIDLADLSVAGLRKLNDDLDEEINGLALLERHAGSERMNDPEIYGPWFDDLAAVKEKIADIMIIRSRKLKEERFATPVCSLGLR